MRLKYLDSIKGLGIILVILYHCGYVPFNSLLIRGVYAMCVPLFFTVNGYLMLRKEHSIKSLLLKNVKMLIVMLFWAFISTFEFMYMCGDLQTYGWKDCLLILVKSSVLVKVPYCNHLWYLRTLFTLNLLNPILYYFIHYKQNGIYYLLVLGFFCSAFIFSNIVSKFIDNPFRPYHWYSVFYYVMGYALFDNRLKTDKLKTWHICAIIVVLILSQWGYNWLFKEGVFAAKEWINDVVWDNYSAPFIMLLTAAVCLLFQRVSWREHSVLQSIGFYSLPIYLMQTPVQRLWEMTLPMNAWRHSCHALGVFLPLLTIISCYLITRLLYTNKYTRYIIKI